MNQPPIRPSRDRAQHESFREGDAGSNPHDDPRRPGLEALITSVSTELTILDPGRLDSAVGQALQRVGEAIEVDHAWLCRTSGDGRRMKLVHEWCTSGASAFDLLDDVAFDRHPSLWQRLISHEAVSVSADGDRNPDTAATADLLKDLGLGSMLAIPLASGSRLRGYAAFATRKPAIAYSPDDLALLRFVGDILADALERIDEESRHATDVEVETREQVGTARSIDLLRDQREILEKIAAGVDREAVLAGLGKLAERYVPSMRPSIWVLDPLGEALHLISGDLPEKLRAAIEELHPGTDVGPFGLSCDGERVFIDDVMRDPTFQAYHHEALAGGVRSCWTEPVRSGATGRVLGLVALVGREAATPSPGEQELIQDVARMTGLALDRYGDSATPDVDVPVRPEEQRLEDLLRQARKMQALGRQAGEVVREFNNAFTAILGNTSLLLDGARNSRGEAVRRVHVGHETVLVCEGDDMVRELAANVLESYGYTVLTAPDGDQAQRIATSHEGRIHLLVADSMAKGPNGRELAQQLARRCPGLEVLFTSGNPTSAFDRLARGPRGADVLQKPYAAVDLVERVRKTLDSAEGA